MKTDRIDFSVETIPAPKPVGPQKSRAPGVIRYKAYRRIIQLRANAVFPRPLEGPVQISVVFSLPIPVSWSAVSIRKAVSGELRHTSKPDLKNLVAGVEDALTGIAWRDDAAVVAYLQPTMKRYAHIPGTHITVWPWAPRPRIWADGE